MYTILPALALNIGTACKLCTMIQYEDIVSYIFILDVNDI